MRSTEERQRAVELRKSGLSYQEIAKEIGVSASWVNNVCRESNLTGHYGKEILYEKCREFKKQGHTNKEVADRFGINLSVAARVCKGISPQKPDYTLLPQLQKSEEYARNTVDRMLTGFSYVGNYTGSSGTADICCNICGEVFTQPFISIRQGNKVRCRNCERIAKAAEKEAARNERIAEKHRKQSEKDLELFLRTYQVQCVVCGKIFVTHDSRVCCCSSECRKKRSNRRKDHRIAKDKRIDNDITAKRLWERDGGVCWICGKLCDLNDYIVRDNIIICGDSYPSVDHVVPVCEGGADSWSNVRLAHRICNTRRYYKKVTPLGA